LAHLVALVPANRKPIDVLIILSGPEPQRTIFEELVLSSLKLLPEKTVLVRGLPKENAEAVVENNCTIYNHAPAGLLNELICNAEFIISRSGYTTVMDLMKLGKKSILVPTPGQAEQEYLATHMHQQQLAYTVLQAQLSLKEALADARAFSYRLVEMSMEEYKKVIQETIESLSGFTSTIPIIP
jgi:predicted glycosyltransferase